MNVEQIIKKIEIIKQMLKQIETEQVFDTKDMLNNYRLDFDITNRMLSENNYQYNISINTILNEITLALKLAEEGDFAGLDIFLEQWFIKPLEIFITQAQKYSEIRISDELLNNDNAKNEINKLKTTMEKYGTNSLRELRSIKSLSFIFHRSIIPFIKELVSKLCLIDEMFIDSSIIIQTYGEILILNEINKDILKNASFKFNPPINIYEEIDDLFLSFYREGEVNSFKISYFWKDFKFKGFESFDLEKEIILIHLNNYTYDLYLNFTKPIKISKFYHQELSREEINYLIKMITNEMMNIINTKLQ